MRGKPNYLLQEKRTSLFHPQNVRRDAIAVLASAIEAHEPFIYGHPRRVAYLAEAIGRALGWEKEKITTIEIGAFLHDLGKIVVSDTILQKPGPLTEEEFNEVKKHPEAGARLLAAGGPSFEAAIPYALYHHERYDGRGYPYGLVGENIPIEGRLLAVADAFEAMISDRPYRKRMEPELALEIIERSAGLQFDPKVAAAFLKAWETGQIQVSLERRRTEKQALPVKLEDVNYKRLGGETSRVVRVRVSDDEDQIKRALLEARPPSSVGPPAAGTHPPRAFPARQDLPTILYHKTKPLVESKTKI